MMTIRTLENIKLGARLTFYNGIYAVLCGLFYTIFNGFIMYVNFDAKELFWNTFQKYNPEISGLFFRFSILEGLLIASLGIAITYLSSYIIRKKDRGAWAMLFIIGIIFWAGWLVIEVFNENYYLITAAAIGWLSFLVGMLIPVRYYLGRIEEEEY